MLESAQGLITSVLAFIAVLSVVVFVHEYGHFQVARWFKVKVDTFSIGFGPQLFAWTSKAGIRWTLSALPLGGYVKFTGDTDEAGTPDAERTPGPVSTGLYADQPVGVRAAVAAAGPFANFLFAIVIFTLFYLSLGETIQRPVIDQVQPGGAAAAAGFKPGDEIKSIDGRPIASYRDVQRIVVTAGGRELTVVVARGGERVTLTPTPQVVRKETPFGDMESQGQLGIAARPTPETVVQVRHDPVSALVRGARQTWTILETQVQFISALVRGAMSPGHLSGPLGIGQISGKVAQDSMDGAGPDASAMEVARSLVLGLVELAAVLSIAVGFMNLLPVPMLDGGHLVFYAAEAVRGKPVPAKVQAVGYRVGLACVLMLFVFATVQDLDRIGLFNALKGAGVTG
jgi:regulator of sigma E protease